MERLKQVVGLGLIVAAIVSVQFININPDQHHSNASQVELTGTMS